MPLTGQQGSTESIHHGQWVAVDPVPGLEFALVVHGPDLVRGAHRSLWLGRVAWPASTALRHHQAIALEKCTDRAAGRPRALRLLPSQDLQQLLRTPRRMAMLQG